MRNFFRLLPRVFALSIVLVSLTSFTQIDNLNLKVCAAVGVDECSAGVFKDGTTGNVQTTACKSANESVQYLCVDPTKPDLGINSPTTNTGQTRWVKQNCATGKFCVGNTCQTDTKSENNLNTGISCVQNYAVCPTGTVNYLKSIDTLGVSIKDPRITPNLLSNSITKFFENFPVFVGNSVAPQQKDFISDPSTKLCISDSTLNGAELFLYEGGQDNTNYANFGNNLLGENRNVGLNGDSNAPIISRCGTSPYGDLHPSLNVQSGALANGGRSSFWGCCPSGYNYVTLVAASTPQDAVGNSACCLVPDTGAAPNKLRGQALADGTTTGPAQCIDSSEKSVWNQADTTYQGKPTIIYRRNDLNYAYSEPNIIGSPFLPFNKTLASGKTYVKPAPALGASFGDFNGAKQACANNNGCALDSTGKVIKSSDLTTDPTLTCTKCFNPGESIEFFDSNNQKLIRICDPSSSNAFFDQLACNNSVSDTLACMVNGKADATNPDGTPSNYTLCCNCRVSGGVWTGIGCTDTTPLGLITGIIRIVFGVVGGIALLQLIIAGVMYQTGDEARIKSARESIIKTLTGLAVLVFSILILRVIGINILDVVPAGTI